jgi:cytochrome c oxidase subunit II
MIASLTKLMPMATEVKIPTPDALSHHGTYWMPEQAASQASSVDNLYYGILGLCIFWFVAITIAVVYFTWKYRWRPERPHAEPSPAHHDLLEITWTIVPSIIVVIIFVLGWKGYINLATPPQKATRIKAIGSTWVWNFTYDNPAPGGEPITSTNELHVPVGQPVRMVMTSTDYIHSLYIPSFRVKQDVVPARYSYLWFDAKLPGEYRLTCAEYCGKEHSLMKGKVVVHRAGEFEQWLEQKAAEGAVVSPERGAKVWENNCKACHSNDGSPGTGPTFKGLFGKKESLSDGSSVDVDENYIRDSIENPTARVVSGFQPVMPTLKGVISDKDIDSVIEYIRSLK